MSIHKKLMQLKDANQDFEFYPTTNEILNKVNEDIVQVTRSDEFKFYHGARDNFINRGHKDYQSNEETIIIPTFLDCGAGDGRVFDFMRGLDNEKIKINQRLGIEIADAQADDLVKRGIGVIGRDFFDTVLIDKLFSVCFSNPPYSCFKEWCNKICAEISATLIYLVIPQRWQEDAEFAARLNNKGELTVLGSYDFLEADRVARAKVDLIRIYRKQSRNQEDLFTKWVEENIGRFEVAKEIEDISAQEEVIKNDEIKCCSGNTVTELCANYRKDMQELMDTYLSLAKIDFKILKQLGIDKSSIITKIKSDIEGLKRRYWLKTFDILSPINSRLTWRTREKMLEEINWFQNLDYTEGNIKTIVVWVIENYNKYVKEQILQAFDDFTGSEGILAYKSNTVWRKGGWRYNNKDVPEKYLLDYRIITRCYIPNWERHQCILSDLAVIASNLGFDNEGVVDFRQDGKQKFCMGKDGKIVFEYRLYQNGNLNVKARKEFMQAWNLEVGKLKNWLHEPADVAKEFDINIEEANRLWNKNHLHLISKSNRLLLDFCQEASSFR